ncbi:MAG: DNA-directed RNA polymerase subunit beta, partial [Nitrospinae bacterium]|nr:DNA-directed RNA polymerase subunit beta [Nitrospinota bacterium]
MSSKINTERTQVESRGRMNFARIPSVIQIPNLIEIQKKSFESFLQIDRSPKDREVKGFEEVFGDVFPISDLNINARLEYVGYEIGIWECGCGEYKDLGGEGVICDKCGQEAVYKEKFKMSECRQKGLTYADPIKIMVRMVLFDRERVELTPKAFKDLAGRVIVEEVKNPQTGKMLVPARTEISADTLKTLQEHKVSHVVVNSVREVKEQKIFLGEMPTMSPTGTFMINGVERVIVSQMHRSPGAFFSHDKGKSHVSGKYLYSARIIPDRGSWIDFEFDVKDILHVKIDRRRKLPATILLNAFGMDVNTVLKTFYEIEKISCDPKEGRYYCNVKSLLTGFKVLEDIVDPKTEEPVIKAQKKITPVIKKKIARVGKASQKIEIDKESLIGCFLFEEIVDKKTGEVLFGGNQAITQETLNLIERHGINEIQILHIDEESPDTSIRDTILAAKIATQDEAIREIYKRLRPGDPPTTEIAKTLFWSLFYSPKRYNLSVVGRMKLNQKFGLDIPLENRLLTLEDLVAVVKYLVDLRNGIGDVDDIDHLGNRRVRAVGESLENQFR